MYAYFDYKIPIRDLVESDMRLGAFVRKELAVLFKSAINDGWDVRREPLYIAWRDDTYARTIRLAHYPDGDIFDKWASRGWSIEPLPTWMREQLVRMFIH
jgi:hypothetical protein